MITIDAAATLLQLNAMLARMRNPEPAFSVIGYQQRDAIRRRIQREKRDPDGNAWAPWADATLHGWGPFPGREDKGNVAQGLLWDDGTLLDSIQSKSTAKGVDITSDTPYAGYLQDGTRKMPARPFMGWTDDDTQQAEMTVLHYIEGVL
jgi:phage virion morphogenesis protein